MKCRILLRLWDNRKFAYRVFYWWVCVCRCFSHAHLPVSRLHSLLLTRVYKFATFFSLCRFFLLCCVLIDFHSVSVDSFCVCVFGYTHMYLVVFFSEFSRKLYRTIIGLKSLDSFTVEAWEKSRRATKKTWSFENIKFFCTHTHTQGLHDGGAVQSVFPDYCSVFMCIAGADQGYFSQFSANFA